MKGIESTSKAPTDAEMADAYDRAQALAAQELLRRVQATRGKRRKA